MKITIALIALSWLTWVAAHCPPTGAVLPNPKISSSDKVASALKKSLDNVVKARQNDFNITTTSFSVAITTSDDTFFEFHHTALLRNDIGVDTVNGDTIYRLGSVTKVFTVLSLLLEEGLNLDSPVWQFVSKLENVAQYKDTTLRMLASQLAGVNQDSFVYDISATIPPVMLAQLGFPKIPIPEGLPTCDAIQIGEAPCTQFFDGLKFSNLTWQPGTNAAYSNFAYIILGFAVENITSSSYADALNDGIAVPLKLKNTGTRVPVVENGIIPVGGLEWYTRTLANYDSTGGMFSTPHDLQSFIRSILNHEQLSRADTAMWLKPVVFTANPAEAVGMPWEIYRPSDLTPDGRPIEIYSKTGNLPFYAAHIALLPAYGVGLSINTAGEEAFTAVRDLLYIVILSERCLEQSKGVFHRVRR
ncbi:Beta-lactamase-like protein like [Verticillium longisporum]|nr:Beta-lactamase-like protein like [Verticillium longisporum]